MTFAPLPETAAWRHVTARTGFEVAYFRPHEGGHRIEGCTTAVEDGRTWAVDYTIEVDTSWATRLARVTSRTVTGTRRTFLESDGRGRWQVDGSPAPDLDGCLDVDLESSAMTNTFPVHRLRLATGSGAPAPAAYVRALDLSAERLDQHYTRAGDDTYDYAAPAFEVACRLHYDPSALVLDYPGLATRAL
ncbi:putative glycolipid-binding domain-containing protein [Nonomuraea sp. NPDC049419]|uniref:putative glycolipid-binding domain-containing protein n=1 Tax=Nonomuraea sp. NPDC049419 TaxID=3155772 RepID=UPI00343249DD